LRIVLVTAAPPEVHCGIGDYTANLASALAELGEEVTLVRGMSLRPEPYDSGSVHVRAIMNKWSVLGLPAIRRAVLESRPDVVHVQVPGRGYGRSFAPNLLPWVLRGRHRPRLVMTLHEYGIASWKGRIRILLGAVGSDALVYPDDVIAAQMRPALTRFGRKIERMIPAAASLPPAPPDLDRAGVRERWGLRNDTLAVGWFGLLTREKGADVLLRALEQIREPRAVVLVLVGDIGSQRDAGELTAAMKEVGLATVATGPLQAVDASALLASLDVVALPFQAGVTTRRTSYLAVRAQGTYAVTTDPSRRGYDPRSNTYFITPGDVPALTAAILEASQRGRERGSVASWSSVAAAHRELYRSL
jgi:glycosyltransferase involved in cell wall biosynthesis